MLGVAQWIARWTLKLGTGTAVQLHGYVVVHKLVVGAKCSYVEKQGEENKSWIRS